MNTITISTKNQPGILKAVTAALFDAGVNVEFLHADTSVTTGDVTEVVVKSNDDLSAVTAAIKGVSGVIDVK